MLNLNSILSLHVLGINFIGLSYLPVCVGVILVLFILMLIILSCVDLYPVKHGYTYKTPKPAPEKLCPRCAVQGIQQWVPGNKHCPICDGWNYGL